MFSIYDLFPYRWNFLYAEVTHPENSPTWHTESRFPLSDHHLKAGGRLYGVRFDVKTTYFMLDIDKGSIYHPKRDPYATRKIIHCLETLGITDWVGITSSYSGGVHLYFPLEEAVFTWQLAAVLEKHLTNQGFYVGGGVLEIFPNVQNRDNEESDQPRMYNGHRLPMQSGSYVLSEDWQIESMNPECFVSRWYYCSLKNQIKTRTFERILNQISDERRAWRLSRPAKKFLEDLNRVMSVGWDGRGQTNFILGRVALRSYIFGHFLEGCKPLSGERLTLDIVAKAQQLPGYSEWCRHQHEIHKRAEEWARCVENSRRYYPYGRKELCQPPEEENTRKANTWNAKQQEDARQRLGLAIAVLIHNDSLPAGIRERFLVLTKNFRFSGETLYKHPDLWHPSPETLELWKTPSDSPNSLAPSGAGCYEAPAPRAAQSLLDSNGCNPVPGLDWGSFMDLLDPIADRNTFDSADLDRMNPFKPVEKPHEPRQKSPRQKSLRYKPPIRLE